MIQIKKGDLVAIKYEHEFVYALIITKIFLFGGNLVYAFYRRTKDCLSKEELLEGDLSGFLAFVDLIGPKREGSITKLAKGVEINGIEDPGMYKQVWPLKDGSGYNIRFFDSKHEFQGEIKAKTLEEKELNYPIYSGIGDLVMYEHIKSKWHQSQLDRAWPNKANQP